MSFFTALKLSLKNLFTKKARTTLTSFAGSIGIIGIALILAASQGTTAYIDHVQETTLSSYPIVLESTSIDLTSMMESFMGVGSASSNHDKDAIYKDPIIGEMVNALSKLETSENDLAAFKLFLEDELSKEDSSLKGALSGVQYTYNISPIIYTQNADGQIIKSDTGELMIEMIGDFMKQVSTGESGESDEKISSSSANPMMMGPMMSMEMWQELLPGLNEGDPINDMLEDLIQQSVALIGKPVALMTKEDKVRAIRFLNQNGAFLVTKSGDKIAKYFGISKYTLYSYIDTKQEGK
jgi:putative ABC transport system permease protein